MTRVLVCGDVVLGGAVERSWADKGIGGVLSADLLGRLRTVDAFLVNVECPLTDLAAPAWTHFPTLKAGRGAAGILRSLGVGAASLANNHIADYGREGMQDTMDVLEGEGIPWVGGGRTPEEAARPRVIRRGDVRIGVLALAQPEISGATARRGWGAGVLHEATAVAAMERLAATVDIAIAYLHFGVEFFEYPTPDQVRVSRALVDAGAKLVVGHHPHVPQGWEWYGGGFIAYSLGNFLFDMPPVPGTPSRVGLLVEASFDGPALRDVSVVPVETALGFTRLLKAEEAAVADQYFADLCRAVQDEGRLRREYYFTCRGHLRIHLKALGHYLQKREWRRAADLIPMQCWPQIRRMRRDLLQSVVSGRFIRYERDRRNGIKARPCGRVTQVSRPENET